MSWIYRRLARPLLFEQDSETIHHRTLQMLAWTSRNEILLDALASFFGAPPLPIELFGLSFPNPLGLAAGMDKHAAAVPAWAALGFGFAELGGVTWHRQDGNPKPRLFRVVPDHALINRMGFNNPGAQAIAAQLESCKAAHRWPKHPIGINLGKSKITPLEQAADDYAKSLRVLWPHGDFFVVNVSSPNTPNLRQLQEKAALDEVLAAVQQVNVEMSGPPLLDDSGQLAASSRGKPILVKVAPDLSFEALDEILELATARQLAGIVATNTTIARPSTSDPELQRRYGETGGLSGAPLRARSTEVVRHLFRQTKGALPIIGVGGIFDADHAWEKITAGAALVQIYTGLIYEGPGIARSIVDGIRQRLSENGMKGLREAIGSAI